ncbi:MAG: hypothetical protein ABJP87_16680, partial [Bauldia litoralis]|uniref:hypothetical protein n=1 Tax=Bauldia litoralis TaxID=665467 RepID=UPI003297CE9A
MSQCLPNGGYSPCVELRFWRPPGERVFDTTSILAQRNRQPVEREQKAASRLRLIPLPPASPHK